jgi:hypothetical protein
MKVVVTINKLNKNADVLLIGCKIFIFALSFAVIPFTLLIKGLSKQALNFYGV